jgi:hypothetical protein
MFVQLIEGRTSDAEGLKRQGDRWQAEVRPGAAGYLGVTSGVTADGRSIAIVRFESEEAARANSARPEQDSWWADTAKLFDGDVAFTESSDVTEYLGGGSDDAGFVQVMKVSGVDRAQVDRLDETFDQFSNLRPDLLGGLRVWTGPDRYVEAAYFRSEAEARAGEQAELPADVQALMGEFQEVMANTEYLDLTDPELR